MKISSQFITRFLFHVMAMLIAATITVVVIAIYFFFKAAPASLYFAPLIIAAVPVCIALFALPAALHAVFMEIWFRFSPRRGLMSLLCYSAVSCAFSTALVGLCINEVKPTGVAVFAVAGAILGIFLGGVDNYMEGRKNKPANLNC